MYRGLLLSLVMLSGAAFAEGDTAYDQVSLSASARSEVANDLLIAELFAQAEGQQPQSLAEDVNQRVAWALKQAETAEGLSARTLDYRTQPVYRKNRVDGWRVSQAIRLESRDSEAISQMIGTLQERLSVRSITYRVSTAQRKASEDELIDQAIAAFGERAQRITAAFGRKQYRIVNVRVDTSDDIPTPRPYAAARAMVMSEASAPPPPVLDAGTSEIRVVVSGTIELQP